MRCVPALFVAAALLLGACCTIVQAQRSDSDAGSQEGRASRRDKIAFSRLEQEGQHRVQPNRIHPASTRRGSDRRCTGGVPSSPPPPPPPPPPSASSPASPVPAPAPQIICQACPATEWLVSACNSHQSRVCAECRCVVSPFVRPSNVLRIGARPATKIRYGPSIDSHFLRCLRSSCPGGVKTLCQRGMVRSSEQCLMHTCVFNACVGRDI